MELQALKTAISEAERRSPNSPLTRALARSGVALLYAHWEGYVKDSCVAYVDYISKRRLHCGELNDGLLLTVLESLSRRITSGDEKARKALLEAVRQPSNSRASIPKATMIDTKSNLRHQVLTELLFKIGLSSETFATKGNLIDVTLCDSRNSIAHGRDYFPIPGDFPQLMDEVIGMMEQIYDLIASAARLSQYRHSALGDP